MKSRRAILTLALFSFAACAEDASVAPELDSGASFAAAVDTGGEALPDGGAPDATSDAEEPTDAGDPCGCSRGECVETRDETGGSALVCDCGRRFAGETCGECAEGYTGEDCAACSPGYFGGLADASYCFPDPCVGDPCNSHGSCSIASAPTGVDVAECACDPAFVGDGCLECAPGYEGVDCERSWVWDASKARKVESGSPRASG